jgi:hypothetical protein
MFRQELLRIYGGGPELSDSIIDDAASNDASGGEIEGTVSEQAPTDAQSIAEESRTPSEQ